MLPNSFPYFIFLALTALCYYCIPARGRKCFLLLVSYGFYMCFDWRLAGLLLLQTGICYGTALGISRSRTVTIKKVLMAMASCLTLGVLGFFKYYNFCNDSFRSLFTHLGVPYIIPHLNILLPVGISFYSFQALGYVIDVYRNKTEAEHSWISVALFVGFFPQLAAGPIGRGGEILPQLSRVQPFSPGKCEAAISQMLWGIFKKVVIADRLAMYVNMVYGGMETASGPSLLLAALFFSIQIYCDFSGYSDIAVGSARLFGIELRQNFAFPYFATSINEFWKRWHISLTSWFRDYLYIPLGGNRCSTVRWCFNVMLVFMISGLWHGADWSFIVWGALHGILQLAEIGVRGRKAKPYCYKLTRIAGCLLTFLLVTFAWIFFRSPDVANAWQVVTGIMKWQGHLAFGTSQVTFFLDLLLVIFFGISEIAIYQRWEVAKTGHPLPWRACRYAALLSAIALFGVSSHSFIYLQF